MTNRKAAIERVRAYVEAWSDQQDSLCIDVSRNGELRLTLGDLRALLALDAPVEGGITDALCTALEAAQAQVALLQTEATYWHDKHNQDRIALSLSEAHAAALAGALNSALDALSAYRGGGT